MPWLPDGTFERENSIHSGTTVWQQDDDAGYKIVDELHDIHDQDLAEGIADCVNLDGYSVMRANLLMGGYLIKNVAPAVVATDAPNLGQVAGSMAFDDPTRTLSLLNVDGDLIDDVVIPSTTGGGSGDGTVTSIEVGEGLSAAPDPITVTGEISLETLSPSPAGTYSNGIGSLQLDKHGRVLSVTSSAFSVTLGTTILPAQIVITNNRGSNASIPLATPSAAGAMSSADKAKLDSLTSGGGGSGTVSNLSSSPSTTSVSINNTGGTAATILSATAARAGVMTTAQVDTLATALQTVDLGYTGGINGFTITSTGGANASVPIWDTTADVAGSFIGAITTSAPADGAVTAKADGFVWFEVSA